MGGAHPRGAIGKSPGGGVLWLAPIANVQMTFVKQMCRSMSVTRPGLLSGEQTHTIINNHHSPQPRDNLKLREKKIGPSFYPHRRCRRGRSRSDQSGSPEGCEMQPATSYVTARAVTNCAAPANGTSKIHKQSEEDLRHAARKLANASTSPVVSCTLLAAGC